MNINSKSERERFATQIAILCEIFGKSLSKPTVNAYMNAVAAYPIGRIEKGIERILKTRSTGLYFPSPSDIIEEIEEVKPDEYIDESRQLSAPVKAYPPNPAGAAYLLYVLKLKKEWDWNEYKIFKSDFLAGRVKVVLGKDNRGSIGRIQIGDSSSVDWKRESTDV